MEFTNENLEDWFKEEWTEEGFQEAGEVLETVLTEVMAFLELSGTVQVNNYHPIIIEQCSDKPEQEPGLAEQSEQLGKAEVTGTVPPVPPNKEKRLLNVPVPPDRSNEMKEMENEIKRIKMELEKFQKVVIPPNYELKKVRSTGRK